MKSTLVRMFAGTALLAIAAFAGPAAWAQETVVATINGEAITDVDLDKALRDLEPQFQRVPEASRRAAALSALVEIRIMAQAARERGLEQTDDFQRQMKFVTERVLHQSLIDAEVTEQVTDEVLQTRYAEEIAAQPAENEVRARHILVETQEKADELIAQLKDGADFETLANENTTDPSGRGSGGDLGYFGRGMMVPPFEEAAFATDPGTFTETAVQTQFGFHIIKVEDRRTKQPPAFEDVKEQIRSLVIREKYVALADELRKAATIEYIDEGLKAQLEPSENTAN